MCLAWGLLQGRVGSGWTIYPPLSALETPMDAINFLTTILMNGPKGFSMYNLYLYLYCMAVTVFMLLTTLPGFGMLSQVMVWHAGMEMYFRYYRMVWSILSIRMDTDSKCYFAAATIVIGIPTRVKIFSWIGHFCTGAVELTVTVIWGVLFIWLFTVGRVTGLVLSAASIDLLLHDTYYVVRHFHYVLSMGAVFSLIMGWYFWVYVF